MYSQTFTLATPLLCDNAPDGRQLSCYCLDNMTVMEREVPQVSGRNNCCVLRTPLQLLTGEAGVGPVFTKVQFLYKTETDYVRCK